MTDHAQLADEIAKVLREGLRPSLQLWDWETIVAALRAHPAIGTPDMADTPESVAAELKYFEDHAQKFADAHRAIGTPDNAREALAKLVAKLELIHEHPRFKAVWEVAHFRLGAYDGPKYEQELADAKSALAAIPPSPGSAHSLKLAEQALARQHVPTEAEIERLADDLVAAGETDAHQPQGGDAREALEYYAAQYCEGWCNQDNSQAKFNDCGGCRARQALAKSPIMQSAEKAAKVIDTWSNSKREYASRIVATTPAAPVREADPTQKQRVAMMRARSAAPVRAAAEPGEMREKLFHIIAPRFQSHPRETDFMYETVDLVLAALSPASANEGSGR